MATDSFSIPVSMLRQTVFCPRIPYFHLAMNLGQIASPKWSKQGVDFHKKHEMLAKRRNLSRFGLTEHFTIETEVHLKSEHFDLHGICDAILHLETGEFIPLEFKLQENMNFTAGASVQLAAYAMMAEEKYQTTIPRGFILFGSKGKTLPVDFDSKLRNRVQLLTEQIIHNCTKSLMPDTCATERQCGQCEFQNFCADRV